MIFAGIVGSVVDATSPKVEEGALSVTTFQQVEYWSIDLDALGVMVPVVSPCDVMLLVFTMLHLCCGWPILLRVVQRGTASLQP
jgi:hypothetical protein